MPPSSRYRVIGWLNGYKNANAAGVTPDCTIYTCTEDGCVVYDTGVHDDWHEKSTAAMQRVTEDASWGAMLRPLK